jgi:ATP-dependent RNA helicase DeaD
LQTFDTLGLRPEIAQAVAALGYDTPTPIQTALLSATMPSAIRRLADQYLRSPETCTMERDTAATSTIEQRGYMVNHRDKLAALIRLLETEDIQNALIFSQTRAGTAEVAAALTERGYPAEAMSGELSQDARQAVLGRMRSGRLRLLVATDVAARGIDIEGLSHVVNYDMPWDPESFVHRIGRTGRAGRSGIAIALVTSRERNLVRRIENLTGRPLPILELPSVEDVLAKREADLAAKLTAQLDQTPDERAMRILTNLIADGHDPMDIAAAALGMAQAEETPIAHIREVRDHGARHSGGRPERFDRGHGGRRFEKKGGYEKSGYDKGGKSGGAPRSREEGMVRVTLDVGHNERVLPGQVVSAIARHADIPGKVIGRIDIQQNETWVDIPEAHVGAVLAHSGRYQIGRNKASAEKA